MTFNCICVCEWECVYEYVRLYHMWCLENNLQKSFLFYHVGSRDGTQVPRFSCKDLPWSQLPPIITFIRMNIFNISVLMYQHAKYQWTKAHNNTLGFIAHFFFDTESYQLCSSDWSGPSRDIPLPAFRVLELRAFKPYQADIHSSFYFWGWSKTAWARSSESTWATFRNIGW